MGLWEIFFPIIDAIDNVSTDVVIQPSYKHMRIRSRMLRQICISHIKLRKTFIVESYGQTIIRGVQII